jgi:hypothetical protein
MPQLELIEAVEKRLRRAAVNLRANSSYASNEYLPTFLVLTDRDDLDSLQPPPGRKGCAFDHG